MPARRKDEEQPRTRRPPARTFEAEEDRLINLAQSLAEKQMREGTASSQVQVHYLRLGSSREKLEQRRLRGLIDLEKIKAETIASEKRMEEIAEKAINALKSYQGRPPRTENDYDD